MIQVDNNSHNERINSLVGQFNNQYPYITVDDDILEEVFQELIDDHPISPDDCLLTWAEDYILSHDLADEVVP